MSSQMSFNTTSLSSFSFKLSAPVTWIVLHTCVFLPLMHIIQQLKIIFIVQKYNVLLESFRVSCQGRAEREWSDPEWSGITPEWKRVDNKSGGTTLASARALCLNLLLHVWLHISGGRNCCQEFRRGVVYIDKSGDRY